jgi:predicted RNase H-like nuclease
MSDLVAGLDGCRGGWVVVLVDGDLTKATAERIATFPELFDREHAPRIVAVDMPIGLPRRSGPRGRAPERIVRPLLGGRQSSVFSIPSRSAVYAGVDEAIPEADRYRHCCTIARETSEGGKAVAKQGYHIFPKIVEIDQVLQSRKDLLASIYECHPEVSFWAMNSRVPLGEPKKVKHKPHPAGLDLRRRLLEAQGFNEHIMDAASAKRLKVGYDDLIDACAAAWTAMRLADGKAISFPDPPEQDDCGLPIAIWA